MLNIEKVSIDEELLSKNATKQYCGDGSLLIIFPCLLFQAGTL